MSVSILNRVATILNSRINELLDHTENPESMLKQMLREISDSTAALREALIQQLAQYKLAEGSLEQTQELSAQWKDKAAAALKVGRRDLALECLNRKKSYDANAALYQHEIEALKPRIDELRRFLRLLEVRQQQVQLRAQRLIHEERIGRAQERAVKQLQKATQSISDPMGTLDRMDVRIRDQRARADARSELMLGSLESHIAMLEMDVMNTEAEAELLGLEAELGLISFADDDEMISLPEESEN